MLDQATFWWGIIFSTLEWFVFVICLFNDHILSKLGNQYAPIAV